MADYWIHRPKFPVLLLQPCDNHCSYCEDSPSPRSWLSKEGWISGVPVQSLTPQKLNTWDSCPKFNPPWILYAICICRTLYTFYILAVCSIPKLVQREASWFTLTYIFSHNEMISSNLWIPSLVIFMFLPLSDLRLVEFFKKPIGKVQYDQS